MREQFKAQMGQLNETLIAEAKAAAKAMSRAATALADANLSKAEKVIDADKHIDLLERAIDEMGVSLLARQTPVATDLRVVVSGLRLSATLERMGDLARHVAYVARGRYPEPVVSGEVRDLLLQMAEHAKIAGEKMAKLIETEDLALAHEIEAEDDLLDELHLRTFDYVLDENNSYTRQEIIDIVLLGRYLERYGDHAVAVARRMQYVVQGLHQTTDPFAKVDLTEVAN
ncbi:phosphate signaling complex protein PhoU [Arcanobacterium hippocoleae]|uniref:Phosphate-specific transport system accessory protein PhoU n=1 Tax=Arcanobacterium hippocoleae TaxID=149017 RepID=A0ABU1T3D2_9ACTO|nr:phosphate signaling complex protein PhoU [Arcanobacterium hippocoleae]MDR6939740.1 phosphate transport system protein [Arcanobacterium hippocoleae]